MQKIPTTILIVDDDKEIRDLLVVLIDHPDTVIRLATTVEEAKKVIENQSVDIIFLDLFLPDGYGFTVLDYWQKKYNCKDHPCTIIMSAFANWENYISALKHEAFYFLEKPFKIAKVRSLLADALKKSELSAESRL
jgi:DNA-binding NtrC family response regulator